METYELLQEMERLFMVFIRARSLTTYVSEDIIDYVQGKNCTHIILDYDTLYNVYGYTTCLFIEPKNFSCRFIIHHTRLPRPDIFKPFAVPRIKIPILNISHNRFHQNPISVPASSLYGKWAFLFSQSILGW